MAPQAESGNSISRLDRGFSIPETIVVPPPEEGKIRPQRSRVTRARSSSEILSSDPKEIVRKYWHKSFLESKKRKMTLTRTKLRRQFLLAEELQRLENENSLLKRELYDVAGNYIVTGI